MEHASEQNSKQKHMIEAPVERLVCQMAAPTIVAMMISALYNMADTYFVGSLGTSATAAVGVSFSLMAVIQAVGFFFGSGAGNYISRQLGAGNTEEATKMAATGFFTSIFAGIVMAVAGLIFLKPLAYALGSTDTILPYACDYLRFILIGTPWMAGSLVLNNLLRYQGNAVYSMMGMVTGAVINVALDPLFIFVFHMGVSGAALATMISQLVSFLILLAGCNRKGNIPVRIRDFSPSRRAYKEMARGGLPSLFRQGLQSVAAICLNHVAGSFGDAAIAAISIVARVNMFASSALIGFGQGFQPVCGFNYGAKRFDRVKKAFWFCVKVATVALLVIAITGFILAPQIIALFRRDDLDVIRIGALALRFQCLAFPLMGLNIVSNMMLQTIGKAAQASVLASSRSVIFMVPALFILTSLLGVMGVQLCQPVADICTFLLAVPLSRGVLKEMDEAMKAGVQ